MPKTIFIIGIDGSGNFGISKSRLSDVIKSSKLLIGSKRQIALLDPHLFSDDVNSVSWEIGMSEIIKTIESCTQDITILASGDPGYFGVVRLLRSTFTDRKIVIHPTLSSLSQAFAKLGINWEDAAIISAHGRPFREMLSELIGAIDMKSNNHKLAVLCSPENPPEFIAQIFEESGRNFDRYVIASNLGAKNEEIIETDLTTMRNSKYQHLSIFIALDRNANDTPTVSNRHSIDPAEQFLRRRNMITKSEVRDLVISKLSIALACDSPVLWDLGAGSGSIGITAAKKISGLTAYLVDRDPISIRFAKLNAESIAGVKIIHNEIKDAIKDLEPPNAVFLGGGGISALNHVIEQVAKPLFVVATYASMNRATEAANLLGNLMQVMLPIGKRLNDGTWRLEGDNPVFMSWGTLR